MRQNDGFRIISGLLKDALMYRLGGVTVDLEDVDETSARVPVQDLTQDAIDLIVAEAPAAGRRARPGPGGTIRWRRWRCLGASPAIAAPPAAPAEPHLQRHDHRHPQAQARGGRQHRSRRHPLQPGAHATKTRRRSWASSSASPRPTWSSSA